MMRELAQRAYSADACFCAQMWNRVKAAGPNTPGQEGLNFTQFSKALRLVALAQSDIVPREETFKLALDAQAWRQAGQKPLPAPKVKALSRCRALRATPQSSF